MPNLDLIISTLLAALALVTLAAMLWLVWREITTLRTDPGGLKTVWIGSFALVGLTGGLDGLTGAMAMGCIAAAVTDIARLWQPLVIGQGDILLIGLIGFAAGPDHAAPVFLIFAILCIGTAGLAALIRRKSLVQAVFPVTIPGMAVAALALMTGVGETLGSITLPEDYDLLRHAPHQMPPLLTLAAILLGVTMGFLALNRRRVGFWAGGAA